MRQLIIYFSFFIIMANCSEIEIRNQTSQDTKANDLTETETHKDTTETDYEFKNFQPFKLTDLILADFNGDSIMDSAKFVVRNGKSGVIIFDGADSKEYVFGCGTEFSEMLDDLNWADSWGLLNDKYTFNVQVKDGELSGAEKVYLDNPSLVISKTDVGGGVITFKDGKFIWLNQSC
jgi:hypothetical protein